MNTVATAGMFLLKWWRYIVKKSTFPRKTFTRFKVWRVQRGTGLHSVHKDSLRFVIPFFWYIDEIDLFRDTKYLEFLKELYDKYGIGELIFTSDGGKELVQGTLPGVFAMVNFQNKVDDNLDKLQKHQPGKLVHTPFLYFRLIKVYQMRCCNSNTFLTAGKPLMVAEFWSGWFDHWGERHHTMTTEKICEPCKFYSS